MDDDPSTSALDLFDALVELPREQRVGFLATRCGDDAVRREVESLLRAYDDAGGFFSEPARAAPHSADGHAAPGTRLGHYELLEPLGEGGFALVYRARQHHPVKRDVALKLIKPGMDSRQVLDRFELERQALAMMDHPGIAAVYDAGVTETGRPYFVMELVRGARINTYCDEKHLSVRQRVRLFVDVCRAVHHAHTKGILHRDLKPSNILVTEVDGRAVPKVIDFGIAKATQEKLTDATQLTQERQFLGTPQYMSPEQATSGGADVDTRSDIYSLGAVLYELLTGAGPWDDPTGAPSSEFEQFQRLTGDADAPRPSTRVTDASRRRELRGEIDWVVGKCLERDRARRYDSAAALADDLGALLENRPIAAAPPALAYRAVKFARRNSTAVIATVAVALALVIGSAVSLTQAVRARRAERLAQQRLEDAEAINRFLTEDMIGAADPAVMQGRELTVREALDKAAQAAAAKFSGRPRTEAAMLNSVGAAYLSLGKAEAALPHATRALERRRALLGDEHPDTIASMNHLALVLESLGRNDEATTMSRQAHDRAARVLGPDHPHAVEALHNHAHVLLASGRWADAQRPAREAWDRCRRVFGEGHHRTLSAQINYAMALDKLGRTAEAEPIFRDALERCGTVLGADHPLTITAVTNYAIALGAGLGRDADAEPFYRMALESNRRVRGADHPDTIATQNNYAMVLQRLGRPAEAEPLFKDALERRRRLRGEDHPQALTSLNNYATVLMVQGRFAEAEPFAREAMEKHRRVHGPDHPAAVTTMNNYARVLDEIGRLPEAVALLEEALSRRRRTLGDEHPLTLQSQNNYAMSLNAAGRHGEAEPLARDALEKRRRLRGADHPDVVQSLDNYASILQALGRDAECEPVYAELYAAAARAQIPARAAARLMAKWGPCLARLGRHVQAEAPLLEARRRLVETNQADHELMRQVLGALADVYGHTGRPDEAAAVRAQLADMTTQPATRP